VPAREFESLINTLFESELDEKEEAGPKQAKVESFAEHTLAYCRKIGVY